MFHDGRPSKEFQGLHCDGVCRSHADSDTGATRPPAASFSLLCFASFAIDREIACRGGLESVTRASPVESNVIDQWIRSRLGRSESLPGRRFGGSRPAWSPSVSYLLPHAPLLPGFIRFSAMLCGRRRGSFGEFTDSGAPQFLHFGSFTQPPSVIQQGFRLLSDLFGRAVHREDMVRGRPGCHV
jgi:hypothetical protein